ncbi:STAS domain-containing protein [Spirillospora albida]|uniref:STAS domain-containing protein n=1 Tax=Spirillospora albida TaxID=58123 RepID=UPI00147061E5|nr:STAS domain-containing protein [Spirillospora albida]
MVTVAGELNIGTAAAFGAHLTQAIDFRSPPRVEVDLAAVAFCDSSGLRELISAWK